MVPFVRNYGHKCQEHLVKARFHIGILQKRVIRKAHNLYYVKLEMGSD